MKTLRCLSCGYDRTGDVMPDGVTAVGPCETCGSVAVNVTVTDHKTAKPKTAQPKKVAPKWMKARFVRIKKTTPAQEPPEPPEV